MAKQALQKQADFMFVELGQDAKTIALELEVNEKTVGNWRKKGDWDKRRNELLASPHKIREVLLKEILWIAEGNKPRINTDALSKVNRVFDSFGMKVSPPVAYSVLKLLDEWMAQTYPEMASQSRQVHKKFIIHLIALHNGKMG